MPGVNALLGYGSLTFKERTTLGLTEFGAACLLRSMAKFGRYPGRHVAILTCAQVDPAAAPPTEAGAAR
eukprot:7173411-Alexandrium_andersonii.AAC.1